MSSYCRKISKGKVTKQKSKPVRKVYTPPKYYTSFNIFTQDGRNITVESKKPMTIDEAQYYYKALSISGND
jgi:hypothetical protein